MPVRTTTGARPARELVGPGDLALGDVERAAGEEAHAALRLGRLVLRERVQRVRLVFVVPDVAVPARES